MSCIFCDIATRKTSSEIIYSNDHILVFKDVNPVAPTHLLLIPKQHIDSMNSTTDEHQQLLGSLLLKAKDIAKENHIAQDGYRLVINTNSYGGQTVDHLHLHLLANRRFSWPPG